MAKVPSGGINIIVEGLARVRADVVTRTGTSLRAHDHADAGARSSARSRSTRYVRRLQELIEQALSLATGLSQELRGAGR